MSHEQDVIDKKIRFAKESILPFFLKKFLVIFHGQVSIFQNPAKNGRVIRLKVSRQRIQPTRRPVQ